MTPAPFDYLRAETVEEALEALSRYGSDATILAGGQSLVPMLSMRLARPSVLVDISALKELTLVKKEGDCLEIGALAVHRYIERDAGLARSAPLFAEAAAWVATPAIRNAGTIGGVLALGDPAAEYPAVALALNAQVRLVSHSGSRLVGASDFFLGTMEIAALPEELLQSVLVPTAAVGDAFGFYEIAERRGDYALAGAAISRRAEDGGQVRVGLFGAVDRPMLAKSAGSLLSKRLPDAWDTAFLDEVKSEVAHDLTTQALDPTRIRLAGVAVARAARRLAGTQPQARLVA